MATEVTKLERVVLAFRGDYDGAFKGAHVEYFTRILRDDGTEITRQPGRATTLSDAAAAGFTFPDVVSAINAGALLDNEAKAAQIATLTADKAAADTAKTEAESARDAALAEKQALAEQLAALQPVVNGVPQFIKKWQLWAGLRMDDPTLATYNAVKQYTESFTGMKRDLWLDSTGIERTAPALADFKTLFHKTDADLDDMFTRYAAITLAQASALG